MKISSLYLVIPSVLLSPYDSGPITAGPPGPITAGPPGPITAGPRGPVTAGSPGPITAGPPGPITAGPPGPITAYPDLSIVKKQSVFQIEFCKETSWETIVSEDEWILFQCQWHQRQKKPSFWI